MSGNWSAVKRTLDADEVNFLAKMALRAYGSGKDEGQSGGAGYIGLFHGLPIKFNTHAKERIVPEYFMSAESKDSSRQAFDKLRSIVQKVYDNVADRETRVACEKLLKDLGSPKSTALLTRKIAATTLTKLGGQNFWDSVKYGRNMATLSSKDVDTGFDDVNDQAVVKTVDAAVKELGKMNLCARMAGRTSPHEGTDYVKKMQKELGLVMADMRSLPGKISRTWVGARSPGSEDPIGTFLRSCEGRNKAYREVALSELENGITAVEKGISDLNESNAQSEEEIANCRQQIANLKKELSGPTQDISGTKKELAKLNRELVKLVQEKASPKNAQKIAACTKKIGELTQKLLDKPQQELDKPQQELAETQQELVKLEQKLVKLEREHAEIEQQIAKKTVTLHKKKAELEFSKCVKEEYGFICQFVRDFKKKWDVSVPQRKTEPNVQGGKPKQNPSVQGGKPELNPSVQGEKLEQEQKLKERSTQAFLLLDPFRVFVPKELVMIPEDGVHRSKKGNALLFETGSALLKEDVTEVNEETDLRGKMLRDALLKIIEGDRVVKNAEVKPEEKIVKDEDVGILKISDIKIRSNYDEILAEEPENDDEEWQKDEALRKAEAQMDKRLENDIRQGIKRYEIRVGGMNGDTLEDKLKPYKIPQDKTEVFKPLFPDGTMTILEREAINEILSEYNMEI